MKECEGEEFRKYQDDSIVRLELLRFGGVLALAHLYISGAQGRTNRTQHFRRGVNQKGFVQALGKEPREARVFCAAARKDNIISYADPLYQ